MSEKEGGTYNSIDLLGSGGASFTALITVVFVVSGNKKAVDMVILPHGPPDAFDVKGLLKNSKDFSVEPKLMVAHSNGDNAVSLPVLLLSRSPEMKELREELSATKLPLAVVTMGYSSDGVAAAARLWQAPFIETASLLEKIKERIRDTELSL